ncbi:MAG: hypothetical protein ACJA2U_000364 [Marinomonas primoryensis]|jgi:hypothetical protein
MNTLTLHGISGDFFGTHGATIIPALMKIDANVVDFLAVAFGFNAFRNCVTQRSVNNPLYIDPK